MKPCGRLGLWNFALIFAMSPLLFAGTTGKIAGKVTDKNSGEGMPGANVIILAQIKDGKEIPLDPPLGAATDLGAAAGLGAVEVGFTGAALAGAAGFGDVTGA